jgi:hypothetical protein
VNVGNVAQEGAELHVLLVRGDPPVGTAMCQPLFGLYRLLSVPKSDLSRPYPTHAVVDVA